MTSQQLDAVRRYTLNDDAPLASSLRRYGLPSNTKELSDYINLWNYILKHRVKKNMTVFRGVLLDSVFFTQNDLERTFDVFSKSFISTSASESVAVHGFLRGDTCCVLMITIHENAFATYIPRGEEEVLLAPGIIQKIAGPYEKMVVTDGVVKKITYYDCEYKNSFDESVFQLYTDVISKKMCEDCEEKMSTFYCVDCNQHYCCNLEKHRDHRHYDKNLVLSNTPKVPVDYVAPEMRSPETSYLASMRPLELRRQDYVVPEYKDDEELYEELYEEIEEMPSYEFSSKKKSTNKKKKSLKKKSAGTHKKKMSLKKKSAITHKKKKSLKKKSKSTNKKKKSLTY